MYVNMLICYSIIAKRLKREFFLYLILNSIKNAYLTKLLMKCVILVCLSKYGNIL